MEHLDPYAWIGATTMEITYPEDSIYSYKTIHWSDDTPFNYKNFANTSKWSIDNLYDYDCFYNNREAGTDG